MPRQPDLSVYDDSSINSQTCDVSGSSCMSSSEGDLGSSHSQSSMVLPGWASMMDESAYGNLDREIRGVADKLMLKEEETSQRNSVRGNIQMICNYFWDDAVVKKYGSGAYGTSVPSSDVDLVVEGCGESLSAMFYPFCMELENLGFIRTGEAITSTDAFVKLSDPTRSRLDINITLTASRSPARAIALKVKKMLDMSPSVAPVYKILRTLLTQCKLKDATKGGLSSYALLMMVFYCYNTLCRDQGCPPSSSQLLTKFLDFFGSGAVGLGKCVIAPYGCLVPRKEEGQQDPLYVIDFTDQMHNLANGASKFQQIKSMFAYCSLAIKGWNPKHPDYADYPCILSTFITTE
eukprot:TRINITY_DN165_c1_g2_i1.p1 TRINITY_DN165_c1_g2~~TRINITY_DN165_c1_g2_i1.p1  ORF type:complete len:349 (+),score=35.89 TRINITY_DN165_c1_g2_i1:50-1096(+)